MLSPDAVAMILLLGGFIAGSLFGVGLAIVARV